MGEIRFGLCCLFSDASPRFRQATASYVGRLGPAAGQRYLADVVGANAISLLYAIERCHELGISAFRINSQILPIATHPALGYQTHEIPGGEVLIAALRTAGELARSYGIALSTHPDQYNVLNSERESVVQSTLREIEYQAWFCELVGATTVCLHGGSKAGGTDAAQDRLRRGIDRLSDRARARLALENDDRSFTVADLEPVCRDMGIPLIYDVHHHRANQDKYSVEAATDLAVETWAERHQTPWMHISSPRDGWDARDVRPHSDFINPADVPATWLGRDLIVDVEAKAKEQAVVAITLDIAALQHS